jgi:hypothetical protein
MCDPSERPDLASLAGYASSTLRRCSRNLLQPDLHDVRLIGVFPAHTTRAGPVPSGLPSQDHRSQFQSNRCPVKQRATH